MKKLLFLFLVLAVGASAQAAKPKKAATHTFEIKDGEFVRDGKATRIISGEMHYPRIPHEYWRHRLQMVKAMGCNAVATYVFWNGHETEPGVWNFEGDYNIKEYVRIAGEEGLMVILRPGPYVCAEWEFGGYPWWLQNIEGLELRRDNPQFLARTKLWFERLYKEVGDQLVTKGGPIVMVQAENEFGSYVAQRKDITLKEHQAYNAKVVAQLKAAGFDTPLFTSDGSWLFEGGHTPGALPTANGEGNVENLKKVVNQYNNGQGPYMVAEFYPGWLMHWVEPFPLTPASRIARQTEKYLANDVSINYYMIHGGTNFGFTSGANYDKDHDIQPDMTSYDYDAPISEAGWVTPKFDSLRNVIKSHVEWKVPEAPAAIKTIEIPEIKFSGAEDVLAKLADVEPVLSEKPLTFEQLKQPYGYVLYSHHFNQPISGTLNIPGLRDYAVVYVNGEKVGELNRYFKKYSMEVDIPWNATLQILVENMGRINFNVDIIHNTKGIISPVSINDFVIEGEWEMRGLPMAEMPAVAAADGETQVAVSEGHPMLYSGSFELTETGDTFLDMSRWGKGIVFVNGHNLGRYWYLGPQQTLYLPGVWLHKGVNEIVVFEQLGGVEHTTLRAVKTPLLTELRK